MVRVTANPGETFLDRMIAMVEGAKRQKTPNEIALNILLAGMTIIFLLVSATLLPFSHLQRRRPRARARRSRITVLVALLVCLIPTTIGGLLSAIGIAGMDRMIRANVIAMSGRAVEAAGDVDVLLLDKTGTITLGNRQAMEFLPPDGVDARRTGRRRPAGLAGRRDAGGAQHRGAGQATDTACAAATCRSCDAHFVPFTAQTRMSGVDLDGARDPQGRGRRDRAPTSREQGGQFPPAVRGDRATRSPSAAARPWWWPSRGRPACSA